MGSRSPAIDGIPQISRESSGLFIPNDLSRYFAKHKGISWNDMSSDGFRTPATPPVVGGGGFPAASPPQVSHTPNNSPLLRALKSGAPQTPPRFPPTTMQFSDDVSAVDADDQLAPLPASALTVVAAAAVVPAAAPTVAVAAAPTSVQRHDPYESCVVLCPAPPPSPADCVAKPPSYSAPRQPQRQSPPPAPAGLALAPEDMPDNGADIRIHWPAHSLPPVPVVHSSLIGRLPFLPYPRHVLEEGLRPYPTSSLDVAGHAVRFFFGNLPVRLESSVLHFLSYHLARPPHAGMQSPLIVAWEQHYQGNWKKGCGHAVVICHNHEAFTAALHKRVLFDVNGVWFASDNEQLQILQRYAQVVWRMPQQDRHAFLQGLPCSPLTVEAAISAARR